MKNRKSFPVAAPIALVALAAAFGFVRAPALAEESMMTESPTPLYAGSLALPGRGERASAVGSVGCVLGWRATIAAGGVQLWYTARVPRAYDLNWSVVDGTNSTGPAVSLATVATQQTDSSHVVYWLRIVNYAKVAQAFETRVCLLN